MPKSNAEKQADYRARMLVHHSRLLVYLPRATAARLASMALQLGITMSEVITMAVDAFDRIKSRKRIPPE